jgi:sporulation protein YlmC with PRC-barrel domain
MRASDLLGARVVDADGTTLGYVSELRCSLDGPSDGPLAAPRLRGLAVSPRRAGASLGYQQEDMRGPWPLRVVLRRLHRAAREVDWDRVAEVGQGVVRLRG